MKIVRIIGGLGNQMFQYAFLIALREKFKQKIYVDISSFNGYKLHNGLELEKIFNIKLNIADPADIRRLSYYSNNYIKQRLCRRLLPNKKTEYIESSKKNVIENVFINSGDCYYEGYWQNHKYFHDYYDIISKEFSFKLDNLCIKNENIIEFIKNSLNPTVSIHIRRGDYINNKYFKDICNVDYYNKSINEVLNVFPNAFFLIFSNDINWCKNNICKIIYNNNIIFVDWNNTDKSYIDMYIMSLCRINIIANSSFSWWAAYLNKNKNKIVIAPDKWINNNKLFKPQLPDWKLIQI